MKTMHHSLRVLLGLFSLSVVLCGCNDPAKKMRKNLTYPQWDAYSRLQSDEIAMPIGTSYANKDWKGFQQAMASQDFRDALEAFDKSSLPSGFQDAARKTAKDKAVVEYRKCLKLIDAKADIKEIRATYDAAGKNMAIVGKPIEH